MLLHIVLGIGSGLFWIWFFFWKISFQGKIKSILKVFIAGMGAAVFAALVEYFIFRLFPFINESSNKLFSFVQMFCLVAPIEEYFKCTAVESTVYRSKELNTVKDGIAYGIACALGFGALENVVYFINYEGAVNVVISRCLLSILGHAAFSGIMGYYMGKARADDQKAQQLITKGLFIAILLHGIYNFLISTNTIFVYAIYLEIGAIIYLLDISISDEDGKDSFWKFLFVIIPLSLLTVTSFFFPDRIEQLYAGKNIIAYEDIFQLYHGISLDRVEQILGSPSESMERFGRDEVTYVYYYKNKYGEYKSLKLVFIEGKLVSN